MPESGVRYAIYYAPAPVSALWRFGSAIMGYDAATGEELPCAVPEGFDRHAWLGLTADPRKYGFHATLKAPFSLRAGRSPGELKAALAGLAKGLAPVPLGRLAATGMSRFVTLTAPGADTRLEAFVQEIVEVFEPFRAPLSEADRARRLASRLTPRQIELLDRFGYPFVAEQHRFHMTLAGPFPKEDLERARTALAAAYQSGVPEAATVLDRLCLFEQGSRDARFRIVAAAELA